MPRNTMGYPNFKDAFRHAPSLEAFWENRAYSQEQSMRNIVAVDKPKDAKYTFGNLEIGQCFRMPAGNSENTYMKIKSARSNFNEFEGLHLNTGRSYAFGADKVVEFLPDHTTVTLIMGVEEDK